MSRIKFKNNRPQELTLVLCTRDYRKLGQLTGVTNVHYKDSDNSANVLSFTLTRNNLVAINGNTVDDIKLYQKIKKALWEQVEDFKVVWIKETNEYFEIKVSINDDGSGTSKSITGIPIPESELSQILITAEINTESDIARDDYEITVFYDEQNPNASLLHRLFQKAPNYRIKYVDASLKRLQRMFSISDSYLYDFLVGECSEQFSCVFKFDSSDRSVSVYDLYTVCQDCGERGDYLDVCLNCGSKNLKSYGEDTTIYVDKDNLTDSIACEMNTDNVKNCFKLVAGDEYMTATIRNLNPSGSDYIYHIPEYLKKDMSSGLVERLDMYDTLYNSRIDEYTQLTEEVYELIDQISYLESGMMPTIENAEVTASTEAEKLTAMNLSPLGLYPFTTSTSPYTVNSALKNYAKVYVKIGYVKLEVESDATYEYVGTDSDGFEYGTWHGRFKVTNYSDEEDVAYSDYITVKVHGNYQEFLEQKVMKQMAHDDEDNSVFDVLSIEGLEDFKSALTLYGLNRLDSFENAINGALNVLMTEDQASEEADLYDVLYTPYYEKLLACKEEKSVRQSSIDELQTQLDEKESQRTTIQKELEFETFLGEYYTEFSSYRRESVYSNDNYIRDGLSNEEIIAHAKQFIEVAKEELIKSCEQQITITATLYNLLLIPEFALLVDKFETGNWLRICIDGVLYRLRLLDYEINYDDLNNLNVTFSNAQKVKEWSADIEMYEILQSAKSMGQTYGYVAKQADKGSVAQDSIQDWIENGLNSALVQITNSKSTFELTDRGLLGRGYDDISGVYSDEQLLVTNNILAYTDNNWKSVKTALGKHAYTSFNSNLKRYEQATGYGLTSTFVTAGHVIGSQMIGGEIVSSNYKPGESGTYFNLVDGDFEIAGGNIIYDTKDETLTLKNVTIEWESSIKPELKDISGLEEYLDNLDDIKAQLDGVAQTWYQDVDPSTEWTTEESKNLHIGDLWHYTGKTGNVNNIRRVKNSEWIWQEVDGEYQWIAIEVSDEVFNAIDNKSKIFFYIPGEKHKVGDLLIPRQTFIITQLGITHTFTENKIYKCDSGGSTFRADNWIEVGYTDDSALITFINEEYADDLINIGKQIDGKSRSWYQDTDPSLNWDTNEDHEGDLWYDTDANSHVTSIYQNGAWRATSVPKSLFDTIDGIASIYVTIPDNPVIGDLLIPTVDIGTSYKTGKVYRYNGTSWIEVGYTDDTKANEALDAASKAQFTANSAIGVAENAETIGKNLVDILGYDGTKITGTHIYSPVISGGSILVGDKNGTYAEITTDGVLNCAGANVTGTISGSKITGGSLLIGKKIIKNYSDYEYIDSDAQRAYDIATQGLEYTEEELELYDFNGNGVIDEDDAEKILYFSFWHEEPSYIGGTYVEITDDGKIKCSNGEFTGTISGSTITGGSLFIGDKNGEYTEINSRGSLRCSSTFFAHMISATSNSGQQRSSVLIDGEYGFIYGCELHLSPFDSNNGLSTSLIDMFGESGTIDCVKLTQTSDENFKNITDWNNQYDEMFMKLNPILFTWKDDFDTQSHIGLGARETKNLLEKYGLENSGLISYNNQKDSYSIAYSELHGLEINAIQKNRSMIEELYAMVNELKEQQK